MFLGGSLGFIQGHSSIQTWALVFFSILVVYLLHQRYASPLRAVPGPVLASFSRLWKLSKVLSGDFERTNIDLHRRYGPIVRIAPNEVSIDDPDEGLRIVYGPGTKFTKSSWYKASDAPGQHSLFTDTNIVRHARERRLIANVFSMTSVTAMEAYIDDCVKTFELRLSEFAAEGTAFDLGHWLQCYAFDVIGEITFAKRFGLLDNGDDIGNIMQVLDGFLWYSSWMGVIPELHAPYTAFMSRISAAGVPLESLRLFASSAIEERRKTNAMHADFLTQFLQVHDQRPNEFPMSEVYKSCMVLTGAGSDTTAIALRAVFYFLLRNPEKLLKLQAEIAAADKDGQLSDPITYKEAMALPFLQAVQKEAMRLHPSTGFGLGRVVPAGGAVILRYRLPEGTIVGINSWVAHRNEQVFGQDVEAFRPERWLESEEKTRQMDRYFLEFGYGARTCLGKNISLMELSKLIPQVIRNFEINLAEPEKPWVTQNWWLVKQTGLMCKVRKRRS